LAHSGGDEHQEGGKKHESEASVAWGSPDFGLAQYSAAATVPARAQNHLRLRAPSATTPFVSVVS